jgi:S-layer homology domain
VSGYTCGGQGEPCPGLYFRPGNLVTRGQLSKVVVLAVGWPLLDPSTATFRDVPVGSTFFRYVETAYSHAIISGYSCGSECLEFRSGDSATRGQIAKIVYQAITAP